MIGTFESLRDFKTWEEEGPPKGTIYNYPPRGDVISLVTGYPAPISIGTQMFSQGTVTKMVANARKRVNRSARQSTLPNLSSRASCRPKWYSCCH